MMNILTPPESAYFSPLPPSTTPKVESFAAAASFVSGRGLRLGVCQLNPYWGAHNSVYCAKLLFAGFALYLKPVTPSEGNPPPQMQERCTQSACHQICVARDSEIPEILTKDAEIVSSPSAPHSMATRRGYWWHNRRHLPTPTLPRAMCHPKTLRGCPALKWVSEGGGFGIPPLFDPLILIPGQ